MAGNLLWFWLYHHHYREELASLDQALPPPRLDSDRGAGASARMRVHSRRWFCDTSTCPKKIFAERFEGALAHYARRTNDTTDLLTTFALQAGGEGGARLARTAGVPISPDTLLRILHAIADTTITSVAPSTWCRRCCSPAQAAPLQHLAARPRDVPARRSSRRSYS